jgi:hypothetical protein
MASAGGFLGADDVGVRTFIVPPGPACHPQTRRIRPRCRETAAHSVNSLLCRVPAISLLRLDGHANIAAANRHHARDPQRTLKLLQTA